MPITLSVLFTTPQDVWDLLSVEGVDLREDDSSLATGQIITTTADAAVGATSIAVTALPVALLRGTELTFLQAGMSVPVTAKLTAAAAASATSISVTALGTAINSGAQARDSGVNTATGARLVVGTRKGTSKVKLYCNARYDDSQLALSGTVCDWATICAAKFLCTRRAQGCPKSLQADYDEAIEEMQKVNSGQLAIEDIGTRGADWPTVTNITVNPHYDGMRARVQSGISEGTPTDYSRFVDWNSATLLGL
jgi:hypothetical protein